MLCSFGYKLKSTSCNSDWQVRVDLTAEETQRVFDRVLVNLARTAPPIPGFRREKGGNILCFVFGHTLTFFVLFFSFLFFRKLTFSFLFALDSITLYFPNFVDKSVYFNISWIFLTFCQFYFSCALDVLQGKLLRWVVSEFWYSVWS